MSGAFHPISPATYGLICAARLALTNMRAAARAEMTLGGDYARRHAASVLETADRLERAIAAVQQERAE